MPEQPPHRASQLYKQKSHLSNQLKSMTSKLQEQMDDWETWSDRRKRVATVVLSPQFEWSMSIVIMVSIILVIIDVDHMAYDDAPPRWLTMSNLVVMFVYFCEVLARLYVHRIKFFSDAFRVYDLVIITIDISFTVILSVMETQFVLPVVLSRVGRVMRVTRALRMLAIFPELGFMIRGITFAAKSLLWGLLMLVLTICFWSILAVLFIHPLVQDMKSQWEDTTCSSRCPRAFESVATAMLTLCQQLVVGEGWSDLNTPIIERYPATAFFFLPVLVTTNLAVLNLLLGVIVERATEAKAVSIKEEAAKKDREFAEAGQYLYDMCRAMDIDQSGRLTLEELTVGFEENVNFSKILRVMDIDRKDLEVVFNMLDEDGSGDVAYEEFVEQLHMMKSHESHTLLIFIKFYVMEIRAKLKRVVPQYGGARVSTTAMARHLSARAAGGAGTKPKELWSGMPGPSSKRDLHSMMRGSPSVMDSAGSNPTASVTNQKEVLAKTTVTDIERELQKLVDIRRELVDFTRNHGERLDHVQQRLTASLRDDGAAKGPSAVGGRGIPERKIIFAGGGEAGSPAQGVADGGVGYRPNGTSDSPDQVDCIASDMNEALYI